MIEFDLKTLPSGMGIKKHTISFDLLSVQSKTVNLYPVVSVEAHLKGDDLNFYFKDFNNENLIVDYEVDSHNIKNNGSLKSSEKALAQKYSGDIDCTFTHFGNINVNGVLFSYDVDEVYSGLDYLQYISLLYHNDCITRDLQSLMLCEFLKSEYGKGHRTTEMKDILEMLKTESCNVDIQKNIDEQIMRISEITYAASSSASAYVQREFYCRHDAYCCEGGTHVIKVYYSSPCTRNTANTVADKVLSVMNYFVNQLRFACPKSVEYVPGIGDIGNSFCIVLTNLEDAVSAVAWGTYGSSVQPEQAAYMLLDYEAVDVFDTAIAHELQHCIQNEYNLKASSDLWWKESCANWASMLYADEILGDLSTRWSEYYSGINSYLSATELSLMNNSDLRVYSVLFPALLTQLYEGATTIRSII